MILNYIKIKLDKITWEIVPKLLKFFNIILSK